jgi:hypothetical protein
LAFFCPALRLKPACKNIGYSEGASAPGKGIQDVHAAAARDVPHVAMDIFIQTGNRPAARQAEPFALALALNDFFELSACQKNSRWNVSLKSPKQWARKDASPKNCLTAPIAVFAI